MPLQPIADTDGESRIEIFEAHRGCLDDLEGFSHVWIVAHLHETTGWDAAVPTFLDDRTHGTFATRSPRRPNPIGLSLARLVAVEDLTVTVAGIDLLSGTPVLDLKPYVPLFDTPQTEVRTGWFENRAERVFRRRSDDRFAMRSRRGLGVALGGKHEGELVHVAPEPVLVRLDRADDGMPGPSRMRRRMPVRRVVAAADPAAARAEAEVDPPAVDRETVLAPGDLLGHVPELDGLQMRAPGHVGSEATCTD